MSEDNNKNNEEVFFPRGAIVFFAAVFSFMTLTWFFSYYIMLLRA